MKELTKCTAYHEVEDTFYASDYIKGYYAGKGWTLPKTVVKGVCWGTKECEQCKCKGDMLKCDFYPEVIEEAQDKLLLAEAKKNIKKRK